MSDSDDDIPRLSAATLAALQEFYAEQQCDPPEEAAPVDKFSVGAVQEDWRMSQFWYSDETAERLAEELAHEAGKGGRIACLSTPSVYQKLKQQAVDASVVLLEYDNRFSVYGDEFVFYDYTNPLCLPAQINSQSFDIVIADPPYLSQECLSKVALTVKFLSKGKVLLCTGAIMEEDAAKLLGVKVCSFLPKHNRNLANEFRCFVNYPSRLDS
ncbi:EEF1A lysine methyltransferase 1 [Brienomyrus brachyistius]|uniref:EEF1A lysine methyltransferase 1 n=1 Tax=Brienomyrus brachyistius TaxID=42636 RepID=UPI0020B3A986|nr:EEF1A lysine methyltransferase 1 [Brienomyrus brachyistius]XP_048834748.1 EEF1A lysine methyltransferase 1 [Brienomyrus brachyistius]XP_048834749.1 EEF1A lysine methyltransferase 1 [Brienomyrus brachyistius]XP_048834750.1 EEF1A lysine methyltransferase 1 [Brienomyrus brachyistius]XP_048834751.1 EEF1A lysine methyltransferase 1 [Brienomyrus brachyistius]XP_048834752.1 EEF1A lysine methyltransferase 1 [Brienomyrus brachyistius]